ncbi:MAG: mycothiol synthase [Acidimicrobiaceae bacterium]|nr:mycothiol synthase [Acidimicrobiaceae bacterium]
MVWRGADTLLFVHRLEVRREMSPDDIAAVQQLLDLANLADGHNPLGEHAWLDLVEGGREGFAGLIALERGHGHPVGYAQVTRGPSSWALEYVIDPHHRVPGNSIGHDLVAAALDIVAAEGGGHVHVWVNKPRPENDQIAADNGLRRGRDLYQMRRQLPVGEAYELETRAFRPGIDDEAWLAVNNRAFDWHPEQGRWDEATLKGRQAEAWFDPEGFLLHDEVVAGQTRLAGFCWTKVHTDHDPPLGEIYVVAVDPDFQGQRLGRRLVLAGLDHLSALGLQVAMLYVDAANRPAIKLYIDLGFDIDHIDRAYVGDVAPTPRRPAPVDPPNSQPTEAP